MSQLRELARPFQGKYVQKAPQGKHGDYVSHSTINERLLQALGPFSFQVVEIVRGFAAEIKTKNNTFPARENAIVGVVARLTVLVDGREVSIEEAGAEDNPAMKGDGDNLKTSLSDALKRCGMRLGLGLHLWSGDLYFLDRALERDAEKLAAPARVAEPTLVAEADTEAAPGAPEPAEDAVPLASGPQLRKLAIGVKEQGLARDDALEFFSWLVGRELASSKELTKVEASRVLDWTGDQWSDALADYATALAGGPPEEAE